VLSFGNPPQPKERFENGRPQLPAVARTVPFTPARRRAVLSVLRRFAVTAVAHRDLAASYALVTPALRGGMTRREWARGDIPVAPYPEASGNVSIARVEGSYPREIDLNVVVQPRRGSQADPLGADVYLKAAGIGARRRWLIDAFLPAQTLGAAAGAPRPKGQAARQPPDLGIGPHLSLKWLLVPVGIFLLIVLVPLALGIREWFAVRRAERLYTAARELPPLVRRGDGD
jgi:hypothetical protein